MAINPEDVKLYESQVLSDEDDGGGRATGVEIIDGQINNLFPDISRLDRTLGDVALRKAFLGIATNNQDVYLGAHAIIVEPPADPNVSVVMFDAGSESDERIDAQNRVESYVVRGSLAQWDLLGNQFEGQRTLVGFQREEQPIPEVGDVFLLDDVDAGNIQYVRITEVETNVQEFSVILGNSSVVNFIRRRLDLGISAPLRFTFPGGEVYPDGPLGYHADVNGTEVADAARYWGVTKSDAEIAPGDLTIRAKSIYANLVPSAQAEAPIVDASFFQEPTDVRAAAAANLTAAVSFSYVTSTSVLGYLIRPAVRGSVSISLSGSNYSDRGDGVLERISGAAPFAELTIDYTTGNIEGVRTSGTATVASVITGTATYRPGVPFSGLRLSSATPIDINNRGFNYIETFPASKPRPGSLLISYRALGKWYTVRDRGNGVLEGFGSGAINFTTGTYNVTLDALPDVGSTIIVEYVADYADQVSERSGSVSKNGSITIQATAAEGMDPGSVVVTYTAGGIAKTLNDVANVGELAGDGTGTVDYAAGTVTFEPSITPDDATNVTLDYDKLGSNTYIDAAPTISAGVANGTIPGGPFVPGTIVARFLYRLTRAGSVGNSTFLEREIQDDGAGGWKGGWTGTIDYTTGAYSLGINTLYTRNGIRVSSYWDATNRVNVRTETPYSFSSETELSGPINFDFTPASASAVSGSDSQPVTSIAFDLFDDFESLIPGGLLFDFNGSRYFDRDGILYTNFVSQTGAASAVGTVNYSDGTISLDTWPDNAVPGLTIVAAATTTAEIIASNVAFRTGGAPLRPQSLLITVTDEEGNIINETAALDGTITGAAVTGTVNVETGVVDLQFTDGVDEIYVYPETGRYSAVVVSFLPLDAEIIGLDPVRLPSDGRVPVFREGDVIVLSHTIETNIGTPVADDVETLSRTNQAAIEVVDSAGVLLDPAMYTVDKDAGTVTFANPLTLQAENLAVLTPPMIIKDRIEHMSVVNDVQISGELSFIAPVAHTFPADDTIISSAKVWGDINSRAFDFFTQRTWNSGAPNWTGDRIGDDTTANYNIVDNPLEIANDGAITEKWAIVFTSATTFNVVGETLGIIATGSTGVDLAPTNPNTGTPYFVMRNAGWGSGWASGNAVRFNTEGCLAPVWLCRTVLSGGATEDDDQFVLQVRGDAD
jgi:hypothetical protein